MRFLRDAAITIVLLVLVAVVAAVLVARRGLAADQEPGRLERTIAGQLVRLSIPAEAEQHANPFAGQPDAWRDAVEHYRDHCASCHGNDGKGDTEMGRNMYPPVPDLTNADVQARSDGALFHIIQNGVRWTGMPAWREEHSPDDTWKLVAFLRKAPTLTEADLSSPEPVATSGEKPREDDHQTHPHKQ